MPLHHGLRSAAGASPADPYFSSTSLLLLGNGTNGEQNNTFVDSSTNNFTITRNGNTTQGSFSPFSAPDGRWSNYFDGSGDYISAPASSAFAFGTGALTVEAWIYLTAYPSGYFCVATNRPYSSGNNNTWVMLVLSDGTLRFGDSIGGVSLDSSTKLQLNRWYHIAACRASTSSNQTFVFINGTVEATGTVTYDFSTTTNSLVCGWSNDGTAGNYLAGYLSNLRILKGTAQYSSAFTPSTSPLTAITNTSLLTCQSNRFIDNSSNAFAITPSGNAAVTSFSPFAPLAEYSASSNGGSGYFDGSGDYLTGPSNSAFSFGTSDFTAECWVYFTSLPTANQSLFDFRNGSDNSSFFMGVYSNNIPFFANQSGGVLNGSFTFNVNTWYHIAYTRSGTSLNIWVNGTNVGTTTNSTNLTGTNCKIGADASGAYNVFGYISNARVLKNTAQYTAAFTPPTSPLTAITNTSLLLNFTNASILDSTAKNDLETVGDAQVSTSVKKFGTGSMAFDGTGDYCVVNGQTSDFAFGTGDFTIEFWLYLNSTSDQIFYDNRPLSTQTTQQTIYYSSGAGIKYYTGAANRINGSALSTGQWYHIALARSGTSTKLFVDGTQTGSTYTDSANYTNTSSRPVIGADGFNFVTNFFNGYIDDLRITKGVARYTSNFTPPSAQLPSR